MTKKILVLGRHEERDGVDKVEDYAAFLNDASDSIEYIYDYFEDLIIEIFDGKQTIKNSDGVDIASYDAVFMMGWFLRFREEAKACAIYLTDKKVPFFNKEALNQRSLSKLTQYMSLSINGLPIPDTIYCTNTYKLDADDVISKLGLPLIMKKRGGSRGDNNFLISTKDELVASLEEHRNKFLLQRNIPNDGDLRVIVMIGEVARVIKRHRVEGSHLSNTSQGAKAEMVDLTDISDQIKEMSVQASIICDREITGVDVMLNLETTKPIILEVNNMPQLVSGAYVSEKVTALDKALERTVNNG